MDEQRKRSVSIPDFRKEEKQRKLGSGSNDRELQFESSFQRKRKVDQSGERITNQRPRSGTIKNFDVERQKKTAKTLDAGQKKNIERRGQGIKKQKTEQHGEKRQQTSGTKVAGQKRKVSSMQDTRRKTAGERRNVVAGKHNQQMTGTDQRRKTASEKSKNRTVPSKQRQRKPSERYSQKTSANSLKKQELKKQAKQENENKQEQITVSEQQMKSRPKKQKKRKTIKAFLRRMLVAMFCLTAIVAGTFAGHFHAQMVTTLNKRNQSTINLQELDIPTENLVSSEGIKNILIVGADKRESWSESGRSDCVMIGTMDTKHGKLKLTSLMRDMYVDIPNHGKAKFNAAYSYGGIELLYKTIAYNFDIQLDGYVLVDFGAFKHVIKALGGVEVELTEAEANYLIRAYKHGTVTKVVPGKQTLNAQQALAYTRIRQDAAADFGRTQRQRTVMQSMFTKLKSKSSTRLLELAEEIMPYVTTDLNNDQILSYIVDAVRMGVTDIDQYRIPVDNSFTSQRINNQAVLVPDIDKNKTELHKFVFEDE